MDKLTFFICLTRFWIKTNMWINEVLNYKSIVIIRRWDHKGKVWSREISNWKGCSRKKGIQQGYKFTFDVINMTKCATNWAEHIKYSPTKCINWVHSKERKYELHKFTEPNHELKKFADTRVGSKVECRSMCIDPF